MSYYPELDNRSNQRIYDLNVWPRNHTNTIKFKNCLFGATNIVKSSDDSNNEKYVYSGYGIKFDSSGSGSFDNGFTWNVVDFGVDNSSSSHPDNRKNKFLVLGEVSTYGINETFVSPEKKKSLVLILLKQTQNFV